MLGNGKERQKHELRLIAVNVAYERFCNFKGSFSIAAALFHKPAVIIDKAMADRQVFSYVFSAESLVSERQIVMSREDVVDLHALQLLKRASV